MPFAPIKLDSRVLSLHKACIDPAFGSRTVLVADTWDYVSLWLKRQHHHEDALLYWEQAKHFYEASSRLPDTSSPLTTYYCFLNAVKALLAVKKVTIVEQHGVSGSVTKPRASLANEEVTFRPSGCLSGLCRLLGETCDTEKYTLKDLLYNLPYIHRAYNLTYSSRPELYVPISRPRFVKKSGSTEAWFCADIEDSKYRNMTTVSKLWPEYERDNGAGDTFTIRMRKRFKWDRGDRKGSLASLTNYHRRVRRSAHYIHGPSRLWYLKRANGIDGIVNRSTLSLSYATMHRLSELARYNPELLARHFECQHNWLLSEFISVSRTHFIDEISSEITGQEFMLSGWRSVR